jgi:DNA repair protein RadC
MRVLGEDKSVKASCPEDVAKVFQKLLAAQDPIDQDKEHFWIMHLSARNTIKQVELVAVGTLSSMMLHPREIFRRAVTEGSASIILAHNHPSGETDPSDDDIQFTRRVHDGGELLSIPLVDHIIVSHTAFFSFKANRVQTLQ